MFNEVDTDKSDEISKDEWISFWNNVLSNDYSVEDLLEELDLIIEGGSWCDFNDGRTT